MISDIRLTRNETPSSSGIDIIWDIIISTSSTLTLVPFMVASRSIVALASRPTIAATSIPPFNINWFLYSDKEIRSKKRSII